MRAIADRKRSFLYKFLERPHSNTTDNLATCLVGEHAHYTEWLISTNQINLTDFRNCVLLDSMEFLKGVCKLLHTCHDDKGVISQITSSRMSLENKIKLLTLFDLYTYKSEPVQEMFIIVAVSIQGAEPSEYFEITEKLFEFHGMVEKFMDDFGRPMGARMLMRTCNLFDDLDEIIESLRNFMSRSKDEVFDEMQVLPLDFEEDRSQEEFSSNMPWINSEFLGLPGIRMGLPGIEDDIELLSIDYSQFAGIPKDGLDAMAHTVMSDSKGTRFDW